MVIFTVFTGLSVVTESLKIKTCVTIKNKTKCNVSQNLLFLQVKTESS